MVPAVSNLSVGSEDGIPLDVVCYVYERRGVIVGLSVSDSCMSSMYG